MPAAPASHVDLLERPLFAHLATVRPDGSPQSSVMWFAWDGSRIRLTHTSTRQKFANLTREPRVALDAAGQQEHEKDLEQHQEHQHRSEHPDQDAHRSGTLRDARRVAVVAAGRRVRRRIVTFDVTDPGARLAARTARSRSARSRRR